MLRHLNLTCGRWIYREIKYALVLVMKRSEFNKEQKKIKIHHVLKDYNTENALKKEICTGNNQCKQHFKDLMTRQNSGGLTSVSPKVLCVQIILLTRNSGSPPLSGCI